MTDRFINDIDKRVELKSKDILSIELLHMPLLWRVFVNLFVMESGWTELL